LKISDAGVKQGDINNKNKWEKKSPNQTKINNFLVFLPTPLHFSSCTPTFSKILKLPFIVLDDYGIGILEDKKLNEHS